MFRPVRLLQPITQQLLMPSVEKPAISSEKERFEFSMVTLEGRLPAERIEETGTYEQRHQAWDPQVLHGCLAVQHEIVFKHCQYNVQYETGFTAPTLI